MDLRKLSATLAQYIRIPPKCFRCALVGIQPSILKAPNGIWPKEATELFRDLTADQVEAEVRLSIYDFESEECPMSISTYFTFRFIHPLKVLLGL